MSRDETLAFFDAYRDAFDRLDGDAVADLWHVPCGITDARAVTWWPDDAPMRDNHRRLCARYRDAGYGRARYELLHHERLGADDAWAHLRWTIERADGSLLQRFDTGYQLRRTAAGPRVLFVTAHAENLQEMKTHAAP